MTDREMAEKWADKNITLATSMYNPPAKSIAKRAYLAGLKAGRPEWHDLRKDPNDLPKRVCYVLNQAGTVTAYQPDRGFLGLGGIRVIAWCEIPTFDKE